MRFFRLTLISIVLPGLLNLTSLHAATEIFERENYPKRLGLSAYLARPGIRSRLSTLRIAVLDNGFGDFADQPAGEYLPAKTRLLAQYPVPGNALNADRHGLSMAQMVWAATGSSADGPEFLLLNANGMTQLRRAIQFAIDERVDVILYSQNWEYGGNFDGRGFINAEVSKATRAGILWINAAGNYGGQVYDGPLALPGPDQTLRLVNRFDENRVRFVVSWSDFREVEAYQTSLDLDVEVLDSNGKVVARGDRVQRETPGPARGEITLHARELFSATLDRGDFFLRLVRRAGVFPSNLRVRAWVSSERPETPIELLDRSRGREIMIPADHPEVLAVGDLSEQSAQGPTSDGRSKPDLLLDHSEVRFTNGMMTSGTSNAAALFAGIALVMKAHDPTIDRDRLLSVRPDFSTCLYPVERSRVSDTVWGLLERFTGQPRTALPVGIARDGRITVLTGQEPAYLGSLFGEARAWIEQRGQSVQAFRFFLSMVGEAVFAARTMIAGPALPGDVQGDGSLRWVEVLSGRSGTAVCRAAQGGVWVTPSP